MTSRVWRTFVRVLVLVLVIAGSIDGLSERYAAGTYDLVLALVVIRVWPEHFDFLRDLR